MNSLEMYNKLSKEDNQFLEHYVVYRDIYDIAKENNIEISNDEIVDLREFIMDYFQDVKNFRLNEITQFVAGIILNKYITLEQLKQCSNFEIYEAIDDDDFLMLSEKFNEENDMER